MKVQSISVDGFQDVLRAEELPGGHVAYIAIHDTTLGPGLGGLRMWTYGDERDALRDVLRLAEAMTWKAASVRLPLGGGKAVVMANARTQKTPELLDAVGDFVEIAGGRYVTAEDIGIGAADLIRVRKRTRHVAGLPREEGGSGDPSPYTARGVLRGIEVCLGRVDGSTELVGRTIAIQGVGHVGGELAKLLAERGARLLVSDVDGERARKTGEETGATVLPSDGLLFAECDVLAPCALGAVLNETTIPRLRTRVVAGAANNQLEAIEDGDRLRARGILYAPDFVVNAGGLINISVELEPEGYREPRALELVDAIADVLREIFDAAESRQVAPARVARDIAKNRVLEGTRSPNVDR